MFLKVEVVGYLFQATLSKVSWCSPLKMIFWLKNKETKTFLSFSYIVFSFGYSVLQPLSLIERRKQQIGKPSSKKTPRGRLHWRSYSQLRCALGKTVARKSTFQLAASASLSPFCSCFFGATLRFNLCVFFRRIPALNEKIGSLMKGIVCVRQPDFSRAAGEPCVSVKQAGDVAFLSIKGRAGCGKTRSPDWDASCVLLPSPRNCTGVWVSYSLKLFFI